MPVLNEKEAREFLQEVTLGKGRQETKRLHALVAKLQAVQAHLALLSIFRQIWELVKVAKHAHPKDGHQASNNFMKFICHSLGCHLAGVERHIINEQIRTTGGLSSGTAVTKLLRKRTDALWGETGSVLWDDFSGEVAPSSEQLAQIAAEIAAQPAFIELLQLVRPPAPPYPPPRPPPNLRNASSQGLTARQWPAKPASLPRRR